MKNLLNHLIFLFVVLATITNAQESATATLSEPRFSIQLQGGPNQIGSNKNNPYNSLFFYNYNYYYQDEDDKIFEYSFASKLNMNYYLKSGTFFNLSIGYARTSFKVTNDWDTAYSIFQPGSNPIQVTDFRSNELNSMDHLLFGTLGIGKRFAFGKIFFEPSLQIPLYYYAGGEVEESNIRVVEYSNNPFLQNINSNQTTTVSFGSNFFGGLGLSLNAGVVLMKRLRIGLELSNQILYKNDDLDYKIKYKGDFTSSSESIKSKAQEIFFTPLIPMITCGIQF